MELLEVKNLTFTYPGEESGKTALSGIDFKVREGSFTVLCGASGCGKTTLLKLLKRELSPAGTKEGEVWFQGKRQEELSDREAACQIGYVLQNPEKQIATDKVWHELAFGLENMGFPTPVIRRRVAEMACFFGIDDWFRKKTAELSGGQKQLLNLASVMVMQPKLLILDEPTSQLDPIAASDFINTLVKINKELGLTILMTEHRLEEVFPVADQVAVMEEGRLFLAESPREVCRKLKHMSEGKKMLAGLPSAVRIYQGLDADDCVCPVTVREGRDFLTSCYRTEITRLPVREEEKKEEKIAVRMKEVCFRYEKEGEDILQDAELSLYEGELVSLLGGNGAGKTTLLSVISGANRPYRGKIEIFGKRIQKYRQSELYTRNLALLPQNPQDVFLKMSVWEDYREVGKQMQYSRQEFAEQTERIAGILGITELLGRHPYDLSGGEQQKAAIGKVLLLQPRILLLDEPTKGIDAWSKKQLAVILKKLREEGITILMVTHDVEFAAEVSDRCGLFFDHQVLSADTPEKFFGGNSFYTTAANRIARQQYEGVITCEQVIELCRRNGRKKA